MVIEVIDERVRKHRFWKFGVLAFGVSLSALVWWQQIRASKVATADRENAINETSKRNAELTSRSVSDAMKGQYQASFNTLSQRVMDLQTQVRTEALQKEVKSLESDLKENTKALTPGPKAELTFTFAPFPNLSQSFSPVKEVTLPRNADGSVHIDFNIVNFTEVDAVDVEVNVNLCDGCKYVKDPAGLSKLPGLNETQRYLFIPDLLAKIAYKTLSIDVIPPAFVHTFEMGIEYRCHTCIIPKGLSKGTIHLASL